MVCPIFAPDMPELALFPAGAPTTLKTHHLKNESLGSLLGFSGDATDHTSQTATEAKPCVGCPSLILELLSF